MRAALVLVVLALAAGTASAAEAVHLAWAGDRYAVLFNADADAMPQVAWRGDGTGTVPAERVSDAPLEGSRTFVARLPPHARHYEVDGRSADLRPPPRASDAVRVAFFADSGSEEASWAVMEAMRAADPGLVLAGGDLSYADGAPGVLDHWLGRLEPLAMRAPVVAAFGDHERTCTEGEDPVPCARELALHRERFGMTEGADLFFDLDWGPLHVVVLDAEAYDEAIPQELRADPAEQEAFLRASLAKRPGAWNVVVVHRTLYTTGTHHGSDVDLRARLAPILESGGADLVLMGNEHLYERTWPLRGGEVGARTDASRVGHGTVYVTSGGGGRVLYDGWGPVEPWSAARAAEHQFLLLEATPHLLRGAAVRPDGSRLDAFSVSKDFLGGLQQAFPLLANERGIPAPAGLVALAAAALLVRRR